MRAPDYVEAIIAWRAWFVVADEEEIRLSSLVYKNVWVPRCELVASCQRRVFCFPRLWRKKPSEHPAPTEECRCGIYGARDAEHAAAYLTNDLWRDEPLRWPLLHRAIGRVSLWGSVVECKQGWRASHAYPERIYLPLASQGRAGAGGAEGSWVKTDPTTGEQSPGLPATVRGRRRPRALRFVS